MRRQKDMLFKGLMYISAFITAAAFLMIVGYVIAKGLPHISLDFFTKEYKTDGSGGVLNMIVSTLYLVGIAIVVATPLGIGSAIYLTEYAKQNRIVTWIQFATESLAAIPSIIYGLFGMLFFVTFLKLGFSIFSGAFTVSIMILPTILRTTQEALRAVPPEYKEGSLALGATKIRTIAKVIVPTAMPGIFTAILLSIGRVIGETAAIYLPMGTTYLMPSSPLSSGRSLSVHLYLLAKEGISLEQAFATATVLILLVLLLIFVAKRVGSKVKTTKGD